jgi:hypothetical protein
MRRKDGHPPRWPLLFSYVFPCRDPCVNTTPPHNRPLETPTTTYLCITRIASSGRNSYETTTAMSCQTQLSFSSASLSETLARTTLTEKIWHTSFRIYTTQPNYLPFLRRGEVRRLLRSVRRRVRKQCTLGNGRGKSCKEKPSRYCGRSEPAYSLRLWSCSRRS